jgi:alkylhydroperoxidase/carboxymuconolactone decarboxylase family protein YurZ
MGYDPSEINELIESTRKSLSDQSQELPQRFDQVYHMMKIILADGKMDNREMRLATGFALKTGFNEEEIPGLLILLIDGIRNEESKENLLQQVYQKKNQVS